MDLTVAAVVGVVVVVVVATKAFVSAPATSASHRVQPRWLATNPGKRWTELFFIGYGPVWMAAVGVIVATGVYDSFDRTAYMNLGIAFITPCIVAPLVLFPGQGEPQTPLLQRFWVKANLWLWIVSFIGNYLWTHYFYQLLGASYTFDAWRLNDVPFALFLITQAYFTFYHCLMNVLLRRFWTSVTYQSLPRGVQPVASCVVVFVLSYVTALMESLTIAEFPYYTFQDRWYMYTVGSACYGLYFIVTFPMFYLLDEGSGRMSLYRTAIDAFGACMIVTMLLDGWRLLIGGVSAQGAAFVPWLAPA